jgi:exonuclease III
MVTKIAQAWGLIKYSSKELLAICRQSTVKPCVGSGMWKRIREFNIACQQRGCRGGVRLQRNIKPWVTDRSLVLPTQSVGVNFENLCLLSSSDKQPIPVVIRPRHETINNFLKQGVDLCNLSHLKKVDYSGKGLTVCSVNAQSVRNKTDRLSDFIVDQDADICAIQETWLCKGEKDRLTRANVVPNGYSLIDVPRSSGRNGGGVAVIYKSGLKVKHGRKNTLSSFDYVELLLSGSSVIRLVVVYRPPSTSKSGKPVQVFFDEFAEFIDGSTLMSGKLLLVGDFNFHFKNLGNRDAQQFRDILCGFNLQQHVGTPTHKKNHLLDLVITINDDIDIMNLQVGPFFSDHSSITFEIPMCKPRAIRKTVAFRKIKEIDTDAFIEDLRNCDFVQTPSQDVDALVKQYYDDLGSILDAHAPLQKKQIVIRPNNPWFTEEIKHAKSRRRAAERKWRASKLTIHMDIFLAEQSRVTELCKKAKSHYFCEKISECGKDQKKLFNITNHLLKRGKTSCLPSYTDPTDLANQIAEYFTSKIKKIHEKFPSSQTHGDVVSDVTDVVPTVCVLEHFSEEDVKKLVLSTKSKSCGLDPLPTTLFKECIDVLLPSLCKLINNSFSQCAFPTSLKEAAVTPLIKKSSLDRENLRNYRPVSNLAYLGKLIEKAAITRLNDHISYHQLDEPLQSAYRPKHSVETALVKVYNDMLLTLDSGRGVMLVLLDMSSAFDTVDTVILGNRLQSLYGITGDALKWVSSYFRDRTQHVGIEGCASDNHPVSSLPQGSMFGPFCFPRYTSPVGRICKKHRVSYHLYADDIQLYVAVDLKKATEEKARLEQCIRDLRQWLIENKLKLNEEKTEYILVGSTHFHQNVSGLMSTVLVGDEVIHASGAARNIGAIVDTHLNMRDHVTSVTAACYMHLRNLGCIRKYLTTDATISLVHAFITNKLDNLNAILPNSLESNFDRLQKIQNQAARIVMGIKRSDWQHMMPVLSDLHWLPIRYRTVFKINLLTFKCLHDLAPGYLASMVTWYTPQRELRSSSQALVQEHSVKVGRYGGRAFQVCAPRMWNALPEEIRKCPNIHTFKAKLKTHLFKIAF